MKRENVSSPERRDRVVDEEASLRRFQECVPRARIVTDASIGNSAKRDYEPKAIKRSKGKRKLSLARRWHLLTRQTVSKLRN